MADALAKEGQFVSDRAAVAGGKTPVEVWLAKIDAAKEEEREWRDSARTASDVYEAAKSASSAFNVYHANSEIITGALYNSTPIPDVRRRHEPETPAQEQLAGMPPAQAQQMMQQAAMKAQTYKAVSDITERALAYSVDQYEFDVTMQDVVRDATVTGRGVARVRYVPELDAEDNLVYEEVPCELVTWDRFIRGPGLLWKDVPFVAFEHDLTLEQVEKIATDPAQAAAIGFPSGGNDGTDSGSEKERELKHKGVLKTLKVYEIWDKASKLVLFISPQDKAKPLSVSKEHPGFPGFFPVPRPLQTVRRLRSQTPVCPYDVYAPQINEIAEISKRISVLIKQLRVRGAFDAKMLPDFGRLRDAEDGEYIPASATEAFVAGQARKGLEDAVMHWPIEQIITVLQALYEQREQVKQTIYEIMGVSDILRGAVDPNEKLGQSEIKAQAGSQRLQRSQAEVARFARDIFRMKAAVIHGQFRPETVSMMAGMAVTPEIQQVMRSDMRSYSIDIETDSTIRADMTRNQEQLNMFLQGASQIASSATAMAPVMPAVIPSYFGMFASFARNFKLGKQGEDALEEMIEAAKQPPVQPGQEGDPQAEAAAQAEAEAKAAEIQSKREEHGRKLEIMDRQDQREAEKHQLEMQSRQDELAMKRETAMLDAQLKQQSSADQRQSMALEHEIKTADRDAKASELRTKQHGEAEAEMSKTSAEQALASMAAAMQDLSAAVMQSHAEIMQAVAAPKKLQVERGKDGRVTGATIGA